MDVARVAQIATPLDMAAHQTVFNQGDAGDRMYIILSGRVTINVNIAEGEAITLGTLTRGEPFGEIALFDPHARTATVATLEPCRFVTIHRDAFLTMLSQHPHVAVGLLQIMARRFRANSELLNDALYSNVTTRLAQLLRSMATAYGKHTSRGLEITVTFTAKELGNIAGLPETVVDAHMRHWQKRGLITVHRGCITLRDPDELVPERLL